MKTLTLPTKPKALRDLEGRIEVKCAEMQALMEAKTDDGRIKPENREPLQALRKELDDIGPERDAIRDEWVAETENVKRLLEMRTPYDPVGFPGRAAEEEADPYAIKAYHLGDLFIKSEAFKSWQPGMTISVAEWNDLDPRALYAMKTTMTTSAGYSAPNNRTNIVVMSPQRRPMVADLIPQDPTINSVIKFMRETTFTNNAAVTAEGATKPESALAFTEATSNVRKIATTLPVTEEQMEDVPTIRGYVEDRLSLQIMLAEEDEILTGDNTGQHLEGFLSASAATGGVQTQAAAGDSNPIAIRKALTKLRFSPGYVEPSGIVMNPTNWEAIQLLQDANGNFIWGHPSDGGPDRLWSLPVIQTNAMTANTALTGSFRMHSHISRRMGLRVDVGYSNDDFVKNLLRLRAEERLSLEILRYNAFIKVTGLN